jgi:uncharacterized protein YuzE
MGESMREQIKITPRINYDSGSDTLYIFVREGAEEEFIEVADGISIELNEDKEILGIEVLNASKTRHIPESIRKLLSTVWM